VVGAELARALREPSVEHLPWRSWSALRTAVMGSGGGGGAPMPQVAGPAAGAGEEAGDGDGIMAATLFSWMGGGRSG
jgi:hypothetical protein